MRRNMLFLSMFLASTALIACGGGGGGNGGSGTGGNTTTTTSDTTTTTSSDTTSGTTTSGTTTSSTGSGTGGAPPTGACTNTADLGIVQDPAKDVEGKTASCGQMNIGNEPATKMCIIMQTGLSDACAQCFAATVSCVVQKCLSACIADPNAQPCTDCRKMNCDPAFYACSGLPEN